MGEKRTSATKAAVFFRGLMARLKPYAFDPQRMLKPQVPCGEDNKKSKSNSLNAQFTPFSAKVAQGVVAGGVLWLAGCGYHQVGTATHIPQGVSTLAVPVFRSKVQAFRTETVFTQAVVREFNTRTKYRVLTASGDGSFDGATADAVLRGTIDAESVAPLTYDPNSGQTSSYLVTITASVVLMARDGKVLYRNDAFGWHEQYQSTQDLSSFVQEDSAAVRRVGQDFAQALVSDVLESFR